MSQTQSVRKSVSSSGRLEGKDIELNRVAGGILVFEVAEVGKDLIGFMDVACWSMMRVELNRRGLGVGAIYNLPTFKREDLGL